MSGIQLFQQIVLLVGMMMSLVGGIWLIYLGFKKGGIVWGILNIFFQPFTGIIFCIVKKTGWIALALLIVGMILVASVSIPAMINYGPNYA